MMCSTTWLKLTSYAETIGFSLSLTLNFVLLLLIYEMPKKVFGSYKYLMFSFSILGIFYSSCDFIAKPNVHMTNISFAVFNIMKDTGLSHSSSTIGLALHGSVYGMMLSLLTIHFYYRFLAVTWPPKLSRSSIKYYPFWLTLIVANSSIWFSLSYFVNGPTIMKDELLFPELKKTYCLDNPNDYAYIGPQYFYKDNGTYKIHYLSLFSSTIMCCIMTFTMYCIAYFGICTYTHLNKMGADSPELQRQLFRTLVIQTAIPIVFMYLPVSIMFLFPLFGVRIDSMANFVPISVAIYICFEPIVVMCFIKSFRNRLIGILTCQKYKKKVKVSNVPTNS